jgi:uncharacterized protein YdcH (DUF465 family)
MYTIKGETMEEKDQGLQSLKDHHQQLDDQVDELVKRRILLPFEREHIKELKVMRLRAKEAIDRFLTKNEGEN